MNDEKVHFCSLLYIQGHVSIKCTATIYESYFESSEHSLPGLGLGEKALESRGTSGELGHVRAISKT